MKRAIALAVLFAAGCAAALSLNVSRASAWSPTDLPPGFRVNHTVVGGVQTCGEFYQFVAPVVSGKFCTDSPTFQQDFDAFVNANYTPPAMTTTPPVVSTTVTVTTPAPPPATTVATTTDTTPAAPAPAQPATTTTTTPACDVQCQIGDLQTQIDALRGQVVKLVQILETWPDIDPGILAQLMALTP